MSFPKEIRENINKRVCKNDGTVLMLEHARSNRKLVAF